MFRVFGRVLSSIAETESDERSQHDQLGFDWPLQLHSHYFLVGLFSCLFILLDNVIEEHLEHRIVFLTVQLAKLFAAVHHLLEELMPLYG